MTGGDLIKLNNAGFKVFSKNNIGKAIHECQYGKLLRVGVYATRAEMNRAWDELMKDPKHISR